MAAGKRAHSAGPVSATPMLVAVDDGYAAIKVYAPAGEDARGRRREAIRTVLPTSVRAGLDRLTAIDGAGAGGFYETCGRRYTASDQVAAEQTRFEDFHLSDIARVAIHHGLHQSGLGGEEVELVCGLPVGDFFEVGAKNEALIAAKKKHLLEPVEMVLGPSEGDRVGVVEAHVTAQAVAAWVDYVLDDDLQPRHGIDLEDPIAVVDIGGRTTDVAIVLGGRTIDHNRSGTENIGVLDARETFAQLLGKEFQFRESLTAQAYDKGLREGAIRLFGRNHDVSQIARQALIDVEGRIERVVSRYVGSGANLAAVLFVGGGALLFDGLQRRYRNGVLANDAAFSNVRGMWKYVAQHREATRDAA